jgi:predicted transcriptional regulator
MSPRRQINIPVTIGEDYQVGLVRRLKEYDISQREIVREMGIDESQFSRWVSPRGNVDTGRAVAIRIDNVVKIERAIISILTRREKQGNHEHTRKVHRDRDAPE